MDQNGRPLEIEGKVNLTLLLINRNDTSFYRTKNKKIGQTIRIFSFARNVTHMANN